MTLEQKINILYHICQSRIEELIFKSIFDYFEANKFYIITEKRDNICIELCRNIDLLEVNELHKDKHDNFFLTFFSK